MLIKAYGQFWNPDIVDWGRVGAGNKGKLLGEIKKKTQRANTHVIDFWDAKGVYVLHSDFNAIYVGQAFSNGIGKRLRDHLSDRCAGRWDMFSWFSVSSPTTTNNNVSEPGQRQVSPAIVIDTLEALAILIADPALNRKRESLKDACEAMQIGEGPRAIRTYLQDILDKLDTMNSSSNL